MKKVILSLIIGAILNTFSSFAEEILETDIVVEEINYIEAVIKTESETKINTSKVFDATKSFISEETKNIEYKWDFGDGSKDEGSQVIHIYKTPGKYTVTLDIKINNETYSTKQEVFIYNKLILLITDKQEVSERLSTIQEFAEKKGTYLHIIEAFKSSTEFISEEIITKKLGNESAYVQKSDQILIWTKENAGLNALSRYLQNNQDENIKAKTLTVIENNITAITQRIQRQFEIISPKQIIITKEGSILQMIESDDAENFVEKLKNGGVEFNIINNESGKIKPWNFMGHFVKILINKGVPDNTIALLLLLPFIATIVAIMKQVVGATTYGLYTPSIITLSFLIIGLKAGLLTLGAVIMAVLILKPMLKKINILYIPKMAITLIGVSLMLLITIIIGTYLNIFDAEFLSIAIFPMLILSTLVEKFISSQSGKETYMLTGNTIMVAIIAYFLSGGEIDLGIITFKFQLIKNILMSYPETLLLLLVFNMLLGKWTGLRIMERVRFKELLRHIEE